MNWKKDADFVGDQTAWKIAVWHQMKGQTIEHWPQHVFPNGGEGGQPLRWGRLSKIDIRPNFPQKWHEHDRNWIGGGGHVLESPWIRHSGVSNLWPLSDMGPFCYRFRRPTTGAGNHFVLNKNIPLVYHVYLTHFFSHIYPSRIVNNIVWWERRLRAAFPYVWGVFSYYLNQ